MIEHDYLPPQADRITTVAVVVDAIAAGCDTAASIAAGINMATRQGSYYPHAAATLGYVTQDKTATPVTWSLTAAGAAFATMTAADRAEDLSSRLTGLDELDVYTASAEGRVNLGAQWRRDGYSDSTIERRLQTLASWGEFLTVSLADQAAALEESKKTADEFAPAAAAALAEIRRTQDRVRETHGALCPTCFVAMPLTGVCDDCS